MYWCRCGNIHSLSNLTGLSPQGIPVSPRGSMLVAYAAAIAVMGLVASVGFFRWRQTRQVVISDSFGPALG